MYNLKIVKIDDKTAIRYRVVEEKIDLEALKTEKEALQANLATPEPSELELIETGKANHPYYFQDIDSINQRLQVIEELIK